MSDDLGMPTAPGVSTAHACTCGENDSATLPVLVAADIPHEIRHAAIFGALEGSAAGIELVAPHDPLPLLAQIEDRWPGIYEVEYAERDTAWRLLLKRHAEAAIGA
ncbi:MAG: hemerythrin [Actinobacteria bacterium HGW-Actinobacteria-8]|nr:MAG: hemerythrin [Actinobacteria bacterium HGW-Actinobacteria-8]